MEIKLTNDEIVKALVEYVRSQGVSLDNKDVDVALTAGRGANGHYATINIEISKDAPAEAAPTTKVTTSKPKEEEAEPLLDLSEKAETSAKEEPLPDVPATKEASSSLFDT